MANNIFAFTIFVLFIITYVTVLSIITLQFNINRVLSGLLFIINIVYVVIVPQRKDAIVIVVILYIAYAMAIISITNERLNKITGAICVVSIIIASCITLFSKYKKNVVNFITGISISFITTILIIIVVSDYVSCNVLCNYMIFVMSILFGIITTTVTICNIVKGV